MVVGGPWAPGLLGSISTWSRTLYVTPDYSYKVWEVSPSFLSLILQYLISIFSSLYFWNLSSSHGALCLQPAPVSWSFLYTCLPIHPHWVAISLPSPDRLLLSLAQIWSLLGWESCCGNQCTALSPLHQGPWGEFIVTWVEPRIMTQSRVRDQGLWWRQDLGICSKSKANWTEQGRSTWEMAERLVSWTGQCPCLLWCSFILNLRSLAWNRADS